MPQPIKINNTMSFSIEDASRDLAEQYAQGYMTMDEYIDLWEVLVKEEKTVNN